MQTDRLKRLEVANAKWVENCNYARVERFDATATVISTDSVSALLRDYPELFSRPVACNPVSGVQCRSVACLCRTLLSQLRSLRAMVVSASCQQQQREKLLQQTASAIAGVKMEVGDEEERSGADAAEVKVEVKAEPCEEDEDDEDDDEDEDSGELNPQGITTKLKPKGLMVGS